MTNALAALKGSDHIDFLLDHRLFEAISTPEIESIYQKTSPDLLHSYEFVTRGQVEEGVDPKEEMLLQASSHTMVAQRLGVPELSGEVERAMWQVAESIKGDKAKTNDPAQPETKQLDEKTAEEDRRQ